MHPFPRVRHNQSEDGGYKDQVALVRGEVVPRGGLADYGDVDGSQRLDEEIRQMPFKCMEKRDCK